MWSRSQRPCRRPLANNFDRNEGDNPVEGLAPEEYEQFEATPENASRSRSGLALLVLLAVLVAVFWRGLPVLVLLLPPLVFGTLAWFLYHVFLRKYLRLRRLRNAREHRLLREASRR